MEKENDTSNFCSTFLKNGKSEKIMHLKIFISDYELKKMYLHAAELHNNKLINNQFIDAGFDLYTPLQTSDPKQIENYGEVIRCFGPGWLNKSSVNKIDFKIKCAAKTLACVLA